MPRCLLIIITLIFGTHVATGAEPALTLKQAFADKFRMGVAVGTSTLMGPEDEALALVSQQYNSITPENLLKWEAVHPELERYNFNPADRFVEFGEAHDMWLVGHTLVWHSQTPAWVFTDAVGQRLDREGLLARMRDHIQAVVGRYRGRIHAWDVVNEALNEDGSMRDSPWRRIIGDDYLVHAFRFAQEADPNAELYYNDYNVELPAKRQGAVSILRQLKRAGCRIDGMGMQGHLGLDSPSEKDVEASINAFAAEVEKVMITELDINVLPWPNVEAGADIATRGEYDEQLDPYRKGLPLREQRRLAKRYADLFTLLVKHADDVDQVTFWGLDDGRSWHNNWPIPGRTAHSLLFDRELQPKPAYHAVLKTAQPRRTASRTKVSTP